MEQKEFEESIKRIEESMKIPDPQIRDRILDDEISENQVFLFNATVVCVMIESGNDSLQTMQSFIAETYNIVTIHDICRDIISTDNRMLMIYSTAYKEELNTALDDAARIRSLAMIVTKIGKQYGHEGIRVNIGMDFGLVKMYLMGHDVCGSPRYAWDGPAINTAQKNAKEADDEVMISRTVWNNLTENNQKLFTRQSVVTDNYRGRVINVMMNNWLTK